MIILIAAEDAIRQPFPYKLFVVNWHSLSGKKSMCMYWVFKMSTTFDSVIPLMRVYPKEIINILFKDLCTRMYIDFNDEIIGSNLTILLL